MRTYLVIIDETPEAEIALRFAARRAAKTGSTVEILALIPRQEFVAWGGVQATIELEAIEHAEDLVTKAAGSLVDELGAYPKIHVKQGDPIAMIHETLNANAEIGALVLGAAAVGAPGPLVSHFAADTSALPCPLMIVPGSLSVDAIDRLS
ncbi:MAG: universal stress protein [Sphingomonadaceae bacterium]